MDTLKSVVSFTGVASGATATAAHGITVYGTAYVPDRTTPTLGTFQIVSADAVNVTVRNTGPSTADCSVLCELWHPVDRQFGTPPGDGSLSAHLTPRPFVSNQTIPSIGDITFGSGQDGVTDFNGVATFTFATLVGSVYTLTRDVFLSGGTVEAGIELKTAGFRLFCNGTFHVIAGGIVSADGKAAVAGVAGGSSAFGSLGIGTAGGNGRANNTGLAGTNQTNVLGDASPAGGAGGAGGANAGGAGGTYNAGASTNGGSNYITPMLTGFLFGATSGGNQAQSLIIGGGAGGGGGGSDNAGVTGGGGGGGGGVLGFHALTLINDGIVRANGGAGADASGAGGNGGGGGGGGGGIILSLARLRTGTGAYQTNGGAGGARLCRDFDFLDEKTCSLLE